MFFFSIKDIGERLVLKSSKRNAPFFKGKKEDKSRHDKGEICEKKAVVLPFLKEEKKEHPPSFLQKTKKTNLFPGRRVFFRTTQESLSVIC